MAFFRRELVPDLAGGELEAGPEPGPEPVSEPHSEPARSDIAGQTQRVVGLS